MSKVNYSQYCLILAFSLTNLCLAACSTQGASRYGDGSATMNTATCDAVAVPCAPIVQYPAVPVMPTTYIVPRPCLHGQCETSSAPMEVESYKPEPTIIADSPYVPPVISEPYPEIPSTPDPITCPVGSILGYGGDNCIPIAVPRK